MADYYRDLIELLRKHGFQFNAGVAAIMKSGGIRKPGYAWPSIVRWDRASPRTVSWKKRDFPRRFDNALQVHQAKPLKF